MAREFVFYQTTTNQRTLSIITQRVITRQARVVIYESTFKRLYFVPRHFRFFFLFERHGFYGSPTGGSIVEKFFRLLSFSEKSKIETLLNEPD